MGHQMCKYARRRAVTLALLLVALLLSGCAPVIPEYAQSVSVYATFYPIYALTDAIVSGVPNIRLNCLVQPQDGCLRNYQLSDWDVSLIASSKAVIMGGRGLEAFESTLFGMGDDGPAVSAVLYNLELYNPSTSHDNSAESHIEGPNPHLYMSLDGAGAILESICAAMLTLDPDYAGLYTDNLTAATEKLTQLKKKAQAIVGGVSDRPVALMNEALIYVAQDYGLKVAEWIDRESGESMDADALARCIARLEGSGAKVILIERQAPGQLVDALEAAGFSVARIDTLATHRETDGFETYIRVQEANARAIREAFDRSSAEE